MNILILSVGRRTKLVQYFKQEFDQVNGKVIVTDCDKLAPALYFASKYYITPRIDEPNYINEILDICKKENVNGVLSLIDPELNLLAKNKEKFLELGVKLFGSDYDTAEICFDKYKMYEFLSKNNFKCAKTYIDIENFENDLNNGIIKFPVFVKPRCGSASLGVNKVSNIKHLKLLFELEENLIIQEFLDGQEYGVDCYIDYLSKKIVSIFIKKKIRMRSGETDKSVSYKDEKLFNVVTEFINKLRCIGPVDIDVFNVNNEWYISEVNPRFGGGYPHAYECGVNIPKMILNNLNNIENRIDIGNYKENIYMIKHDTVMIKEEK